MKNFNPIGYSLLFAFLLNIGHLSAQVFLHPSAPSDDRSLDLIDLERAFLEWSEDKDLTQTKGWKWHQRWLNEQIIRSNVKGEMPNQRPLFEAATELAKIKKSNAVSRAESWMPVGPSVLPEVPFNEFFRGMGRINTIAFHPTDASTFWVGVAQGGVWKTTNSGASWLPLTDDLPIIRISDIALDPNDTDVMYISVGDYAYLGFALELNERKRNTHYGLGVFKTTDGGQNWAPTGLMFDQTDKDASLTRRVYVNPENSNELVAAGIHGIWRSSDAGDTWTQTHEEMIWDIEKDPANANILYASMAYVNNLGSGSTGILKSVDFGDTWTELNTGIPNNGTVQRIELNVAPSNSNYVYALATNLNGGFYGLYRSTDAGNTWTQRSYEPNVLTWGGGQGSSGQGTYDLALLVDHNDPDKIYTGGINVWGSENGGLSWQNATYWLPSFGPSIHADQHYFAYNPLDGKMYVCNDGGVYRTNQINLSNFGSPLNTDWEDISGGMEITSFYRLGLSTMNDDYVIAGSQDNAVMLKKGEEWLNVVLGDGMECFFHSTNDDIIFASTQYGRLVRSDDGGLNFGNNLSGQILNAEAAEWTTPFMKDPSQSNTVYTAMGNVWRSTNLGNSWTKLTNFPDMPGQDFPLPTSTLSIAPSDANVMYVGKRIYPTSGIPGKFYRLTNGGSTTVDVTAGLPDSLYFTASTVNNTNPMEVWVTAGGFADGVKVFKSSDGGDNWENISLNLPNVPANAIIHQPNSTSNTVYVGTDIGIYYLDETATEWELYSDDLPNVIVTDLQINEGTEQIYASTFGRGIWVSDLANSSSTSVRKELEKINIALSPNPNDGQFTLNLEQLNLSNLQLQIVDIMGRKIYEEQLQTPYATYRKTFDLDLNYGMYFLRLSNGNSGRVIKFIVD